MAYKFGEYLRVKRNKARLTQEQLATAIGKTGMYISNIEKGKNYAPPKQEDLDALVEKLNLTSEERITFFEAAAADRSTLPKDMIDYINKCPSLRDLLRIAIDRDISDNDWKALIEAL